MWLLKMTDWINSLMIEIKCKEINFNKGFSKGGIRQAEYEKMCKVDKICAKENQ